MLNRGYQPLGPAIRNAEFRTGSVIPYRLEAQTGQCIAVLVVASAGTTPNLVLTNASGNTVAYNMNQDGHPWVHHCPPISGPLTARVQTLGTPDPNYQKEYYYAAYAGPIGRTPTLTAFFAGTSRAQDPETSPTQTGTTTPGTVLPTEIQARLSRLDSTLDNQGFARSAAPHGESMGPAHARDFTLNLRADHCYQFHVLGSTHVTDTDMILTDMAGQTLRQDPGGLQDAHIEYCAPQAQSLRLRVRLNSLSGNAKTGQLYTAAYAQKQAGEALSKTVLSEQSEDAEQLLAQFRLLDSDMQTRGYLPFGPSQNGTLNENQTQRFALNIEANKCYAVVAVGDAGVRDLDLVLEDANNAVVDRDVETDARPTVRACTETTGKLNVEVRMVRGSGNYTYAAYAWPRGTQGPFGLHGVTFVRLSEMTTLLALDNYEPDLDHAPGKGTLSTSNAHNTHAVDLTAGTCYAVVAVGDAGIHDLNLTLISNAGGTKQVVARDDTRTAFPHVRYCPTRSSQATVEIGNRQGEGTYFYQLFIQSNGTTQDWMTP